MNTSIISLINSDVSLKELTEAGKHVLYTIVIENFPLINSAKKVYEQMEHRRLEKAIDDYGILLGILLNADESNFYTHRKIINNLMFSDIVLKEDVQKKIVDYVGNNELKDNKFNKGLKWLLNKQNFELNIISEYKLFIAEKDNDIYITVEDTELVISDLFENNIPKGTYNTGPRKYQKLSDFGLYVFRKIFQNSEIDLEFERVKKEVSFINQVCFPKLEPYFTATNSQLKKKIESECSPDDKYSFLSDVEKEYICYVTKLNYVVEITKTSNLSDSSELTELILSTDDKKTSENYVAKYINVNEINNALPGKTYHMKEVYEFSHKVDHDYVDFWPKFFKSISSK